MKHKSPDYKLSAVNYYLNHDVGYDNTSKSWLEKYLYQKYEHSDKFILFEKNNIKN